MCEHACEFVLRIVRHTQWINLQQPQTSSSDCRNKFQLAVSATFGLRVEIGLVLRLDVLFER